MQARISSSAFFRAKHTRIRRSVGDIIFDTANVIFMIILSLLTIYPLLYVLFSSLSDAGLLMQHRGLLLAPINPTTLAYELVFLNPNILRGYGNTLIYVIGGTSFSMLLTVLGAYAFSRKGAMLVPYMLFFVVFTMWFSGGMIPRFLLVRDLGLLNSRLAMIIPSAISTFNLIIMRTAFRQIPASLEESAQIDGARDLTILFRIVIPLSMPVIAVIILFYAVANWNAWFDAMIFFNRRELFPLQLILREILILNSFDAMVTGAAVADEVQIGETIKYATVVIATVPILFIYPFLQKYFVKGIMIGAIKE